ncbi:hypothetical protein [Methylobacterium trifolii]|uniref:Uncharacterized protein n=1 Tax=Methylobacterium trifolii TaxID=1003092 RepID=A0ABQ4TZT0_9HYPH|nr:hypothetical protein [Methylobacterium trifolii]GJE60733.1 hypothetical protein MPOCJGCO_2849 [Methylobacterium trifolii]
MRMILAIRAVALLRLGSAEIERSRVCGRWADEALDRAKARFAEAEALGQRLERMRT